MVKQWIQDVSRSKVRTTRYIILIFNSFIIILLKIVCFSNFVMIVVLLLYDYITFYFINIVIVVRFLSVEY